ncbi:hypothetical protein [Bacillus pseudomycoides]|uniref:hypothetical protein n=1 Tax=Bacillus pseudomycoides TaxID=64104 RepID=UPI002FFE6B7D
MKIKTVEGAIKFHGEKFIKFGKGERYVRDCIKNIIPVYENDFSEEELARIVSNAIVNTVGWLNLPNKLIDYLEEEKAQKIEDELLRQQIQKRRIEEQALQYAKDFREGKRG